MKNTLAIFIFCIVPLQFIHANEPITLNISEGGYPPYMINNKTEKISGIMVDVLEVIANKYNHAVNYVGIPKNRVEIMILAGTLDATPNAKEWVSNQDDFIFSDAIIVVKDVLFSPSQTPLKYTQPSDLSQKRIGIILGYYYPRLQPFIDDGKIQTTEAINEILMLKKTLKGRSQGAVVNELVGKWIIKNDPSMQGEFFISKEAISSYEYRIMFNKKWHSFVSIFNQELAIMKENGDLSKIIMQYN